MHTDPCLLKRALAFQHCRGQGATGIGSAWQGLYLHYVRHAVWAFFVSGAVWQLEQIPRGIHEAHHVILWMLFVDDSCMVDLIAARGEAQIVEQKAVAGIGVRHAMDKRQRMGPRTDFLDITRVLLIVVGKQLIRHGPKQIVQEQLEGLISARLQEGTCTPAQASKLQSICGWSATAQFQHIGRAARRPLMGRQYLHKYHPLRKWMLTDALKNIVCVHTVRIGRQP